MIDTKTATRTEYAMHVCLLKHDDARKAILDYIAQFYSEKQSGMHTRDNPCDQCKPDYQPKSSGWITRERRDAIKRRDKYQCVWCGIDVRTLPANDQTLDHLVTLEEYEHLPVETRIWFGSKHKTGNVVSSCRACNGSRKATDYCRYSTLKNVEKRISKVITDRKRLDIAASKRKVGNTRKTYKNAWITRQRLSQGIGTDES